MLHFFSPICFGGFCLSLGACELKIVNSYHFCSILCTDPVQVCFVHNVCCSMAATISVDTISAYVIAKILDKYSHSICDVQLEK